MTLAKAFNPPAILVSPTREGSFRDTCRTAEVPIILLESGEALRLDSPTIRFGLQGILSVMRHLDMLPKRKRGETKKTPTVICRKSSWERAPSGGLFTSLMALGQAVTEGDDHPVHGDVFSDNP